MRQRSNGLTVQRSAPSRSRVQLIQSQWQLCSIGVSSPLSSVLAVLVRFLRQCLTSEHRPSDHPYPHPSFHPPTHPPGRSSVSALGTIHPANLNPDLFPRSTDARPPTGQHRDRLNHTDRSPKPPPPSSHPVTSQQSSRQNYYYHTQPTSETSSHHDEPTTARPTSPLLHHHPYPHHHHHQHHQHPHSYSPLPRNHPLPRYSCYSAVRFLQRCKSRHHSLESASKHHSPKHGQRFVAGRIVFSPTL